MNATTGPADLRDEILAAPAADLPPLLERWYMLTGTEWTL